MAMRYYDIPVGPITFIPFMGAVVEMRGQPVSAYQEAFIALAGPLVGTAATIPFMAFGVMGGSQFALALAHWGCMVNLMNLLPIGSLDGGRVAGALSKYTLPMGLGLCGGLIALYPANPLLYLVFLSGGYTTYQRFYGSGEADYKYYQLSANERATVAASYASLVAGIAYMMHLNDTLRKSPQQLQRELGIAPSEWIGDDSTDYFK
jgi:Zn-dependent protease